LILQCLPDAVGGGEASVLVLAHERIDRGLRQLQRRLDHRGFGEVDGPGGAEAASGNVVVAWVGAAALGRRRGGEGGGELGVKLGIGNECAVRGGGCQGGGDARPIGELHLVASKAGHIARAPDCVGNGVAELGAGAAGGVQDAGDGPGALFPAGVVLEHSVDGIPAEKKGSRRGSEGAKERGRRSRREGRGAHRMSLTAKEGGGATGDVPRGWVTRVRDELV
jgi:hypothetical protein